MLSVGKEGRINGAATDDEDLFFGVLIGFNETVEIANYIIWCDGGIDFGGRMSIWRSLCVYWMGI